jgi:hypothetical protein
MQFTEHAQKRLQQRGIPRDIVELILSSGVSTTAPGKVMEYYVHKKERDKLLQDLRQCIKMVEKSNKIRILASEDGKIITLYHKS